MRKYISIILSLVLILSLSACGNKETDTSSEDTEESSGQNETQTVEDSGQSEEDDTDESIENKNPYEDILKEEDKEEEDTEEISFPVNQLQCSYGDVKIMKNIAVCYSNCPQQFASSSELSAEAMFFAAAAYRSEEFTENPDGFTSSLPISELISGIQEIFGETVNLPEGWTSDDFSPYTVNVTDQTIETVASGTPATFFYTWAVTDEGNGTYKLYLLNLQDPLFSDNSENEELTAIGNGDIVSVDDVKDIASQMQTHVFTFTSSEGTLHLTGFEYINYKGIGSVVS